MISNIELGDETMSKVLCFDPSGNYGSEGMGTTGWAIFELGQLVEFGEIRSTDYDNQESYWLAHLLLIYESKATIVVCESYRLFGHKSKQQHGSSLDTPQLIGAMRVQCWNQGKEFIFQDPTNKTPVADPILVRQGVFEVKGGKHYCMGKSTNLHMRDAIRHGVFYFRHGKGKRTNGSTSKSTNHLPTLQGTNGS
jgi:hypothetical protein